MGFGVQGVGLVVQDLDRMARFYRTVLGLPVAEPGAGRAVLGGLLELEQRPGARPRDPAAAGLFHTAFLLPGRADLGRWLLHAQAEGVQLDGAADHLVSEAVYLHDPEGNGIEVYVDRPASEWVWTGGRVQMANARLDRAGLVRLADRPWSGAPPGTRIGNVHLQVWDAAQAASFYGDVLGLELTATRPEAVFMARDRYHHHIAANTWNSAGAGMREADRAGLAWVALHGPEPAEFTDPWGTVIRTQPEERLT